MRLVLLGSVVVGRFPLPFLGALAAAMAASSVSQVRVA